MMPQQSERSFQFFSQVRVLAAQFGEPLAECLVLPAHRGFGCGVPG